MDVEQVNLKCPDGHNLVSCGKVSLTFKNGSKHIVPMYRCRYCNEKYMNTQLLDMYEIITCTNGHRITNLFNKQVVTTTRDYEGESIAAYIVKKGEKRPKKCIKCDTKLKNYNYIIKKSGKNKKITLVGAICSNCKAKYFNYDLYMHHKYAFTPINYQVEQKEWLKNESKVTDRQTALNKISSTKEQNEQIIQVYIRLSNKSNACEKCQGILNSGTQSYYSNGKKTKSFAFKKCVMCGTKYISYGTYETIKKHNIDVINQTELDFLELEYKKKKEAKKQRKRKLKAKSDNNNSIKKDLYIKSYSSEIKNQKAVLKNRKTPSYYNYCMCELENISNGEIFKVTVNNGASENLSDKNNQIYPVGTGMAEGCLKAAANDLKEIYVNGVGYRVLRHVRYDAVYVDQYIDPVRKTVSSEKNRTKVKTIQSYQYQHQGTVDARTEVKDVYVYFRLQSCRCIQQKHKINSVTLKTQSITSSKNVNINAYYCCDCNMYFVNNDAIRSLLLKHSCPLVRFHIVRDFSGHLNPESELKMYGYTVQEGVLSERQRHNLLAVLIDRNLMSKTEIIKCIQFNIEFVGKRSNMENAKDRWKNDIQFVSQYVVGNREKINGRLVR